MASLNISGWAVLLMSCEVRPKWMNSPNRSRPISFNCSLMKYSTAFTSWLVTFSMSFTRWAWSGVMFR